MSHQRRALNHVLGDAVRRMLARLPVCRPLFKLARMYVNFYNGEENPDIATNGEARLLRDVMPGASVVFDVGANVGQWARVALRANPQLQLHCFEPSPATFAALSSWRWPGNVICRNMGLSDRDGQMQLHTFGGIGETDSLHPRQHAMLGDPQTQPVSVTTLDGYCHREGIERIDFLKIDTEGHELPILNGAAGLLDRHAIGAVQFEYSAAWIEAGAFFRHAFEMLGRRGYRCFKILPRSLQEVPRYAEGLESFRLSNWLFVHPDTPISRFLIKPL